VAVFADALKPAGCMENGLEQSHYRMRSGALDCAPSGRWKFFGQGTKANISQLSEGRFPESMHDGCYIRQLAAQKAKRSREMGKKDAEEET